MFVDISLLELENLGQNNVNSLSWFHLKYQQRLENYEKNISYKKLRKCKIYTTIIDLTTFNCNRISFVLYLRSFVTSKGKLYLKDTTHSFIIKICHQCWLSCCSFPLSTATTFIMIYYNMWLHYFVSILFWNLNKTCGCQSEDKGWICILG